mmetsp:Transcript_10366/g.23989  ORF Transcript_10366/g.23989 Transcript_10366/m.23989 type:complete len:527 (+) Transcript_10366:79-1659(+)
MAGPSGNGHVFVVYDEGMLAHAHMPMLQKKHPEKPSRLTTIHALLGQLGLLQRCDCEAIKPREATDAEILRAHSPEHLAEVRQITADVARSPTNRELREPDGPGGIYYSPDSLHAGLLAAGCVIEMSEHVLRLHAEEQAAKDSGCGVAIQKLPVSALALVRPPGHHAGYDDTPGHRAEGFCFFNSVACAARTAIARGLAQRVLIVDYDVHHGNGTERIFYEASDVMYMSIHRYGRNFYPETGALDDAGEGAGLGRFTLNLPWTQTGYGDAEYIAACHLLLLPVAKAFDPQLVLVSAGFDAAEGDVQGGMRVTPTGFAQMTRLLSTLNKPMGLALEGGYNQGVTANCVAEVTRALLGDVPVLGAMEAAESTAVSLQAEQQLRAAIALQRTHWPVLGSDAHVALVEHFFNAARRQGSRTHRVGSLRVQQAHGLAPLKATKPPAKPIAKHLAKGTGAAKPKPEHAIAGGGVTIAATDAAVADAMQSAEMGSSSGTPLAGERGNGASDAGRGAGSGAYSPNEKRQRVCSS